MDAERCLLYLMRLGSSERHVLAPASLGPKPEDYFVRFLTPTDNKRLNELIGFLFMIVAVLVALCLISYSPHDVAFNVSAPPADGPLAHNWIGPVGAYGADFLFQVFGFAAFLLPVAILILGWKWFRSRAINSQLAP